MNNKILIRYSDVDIFQQDHLILQNIDFEVHEGEFIFLLGNVGSGKSSLLKSIYCEIPTVNGQVDVLGYDISKISINQIPYLRRKIGIVFQDFQLLTDRNVSKNLEFVLRSTGWKSQNDIEEQIDQVLTQVGMNMMKNKMPYQLSGGEQQRVVIARALLNSPEIILADEPTGNLDSLIGNELMELLYSISQMGTTVVMATHNLSWVEKFPSRKFKCENSKLIEYNDFQPL